MKTLVTLGLVAGLALATLPASAGTLTIAGSEATGLAVTTEADGDALPPGTLAPATVLWLEQRLSLLAARIAEPLVKSGTVLVPPQS